MNQWKYVICINYTFKKHYTFKTLLHIKWINIIKTNFFLLKFFLLIRNLFLSIFHYINLFFSLFSFVTVHIASCTHNILICASLWHNGFRKICDMEYSARKFREWQSVRLRLVDIKMCKFYEIYLFIIYKGLVTM